MLPKTSQDAFKHASHMWKSTQPAEINQSHSLPSHTETHTPSADRHWVLRQLRQSSVRFPELSGLKPTMEGHLALLLLWTLTAWVGISESQEISVIELPDGIKIKCESNYLIKHPDGPAKETITLKNADKNSGEYTCYKNDTNEEGSKIYVKFRTCDNCIELDVPAVSGIAVGEVVATLVIGVAVYLVASIARTGSAPTNKKSSDRQHLVPNEVTNRPTNDHYQPLRPKAGQKDMYDVLNNRR